MLLDRRQALAGAIATAISAPASRAQSVPAIGETLDRFATDEHPDLKAIVVHRNGARVAERYFNGDDAATLHDIRSAGKSITSLLIGLARDRHLIGSLRTPIDHFVPRTRGTPIGSVALEDVLTMRSGLDADDTIAASPGNEDKLDDAPDPIAFLCSVPRTRPPGSFYLYNSLTAFAAGLVVEGATRRHGADFARETLFAPLGIDRFEWASDAAGHTKGQGNLSITARDFATIGQMVLDRGVYGSRRILSAGWIDASLKPRVSISFSDPYADSYGYFWYTKVWNIGGEPVPVHFASGNGGNKIYLVPTRQMVVAITSSAYGHGYGQRRSQAILAALLGA